MFNLGARNDRVSVRFVTPLRVVIALFLFAVLAFSVPAQSRAVDIFKPVNNFSSSDIFSVDWIVTFIESAYNAGENITFNFSFLDSATQKKPSGGTLHGRVNSGSYTQLVSSSNDNAQTSLSLPPAGGGSEPSSVEFLSRVGGWFTISDFNEARFGEKEYNFAIQLGDDSESPTTVSSEIVGGGLCELDQQTTFSVTSTDPDGDNLYYTVYFGDETTSTRLPSSGYVSSGTAQTFSRTVTQAGTYIIQARATDTNGNVSSWVQVPIPCGLCTHCTYDGGSGTEIDFRAVPALVTQGGTSNLTWDLTNVYKCSISGSNGDSWGWSTVRTVQQATTSALTESTTYTMTCEDEDGDPVTGQTTVHLVPLWEEF